MYNSKLSKIMLIIVIIFFAKYIQSFPKSFYNTLTIWSKTTLIRCYMRGHGADQRTPTSKQSDVSQLKKYMWNILNLG